MNISTLRLGGVVAVIAMAGCSSGATAPPSPTQANLSQNVLQVAIGRATLPGGAVGMNVVTTLRQPNGFSAVGIDQPTLTGPFTLPATAGTANANGATVATGPSAAEIAGSASGCTGPCITGTVQQTPGVPAASIPATTFGTEGGAFAIGFSPFNETANGAPAGGFNPYIVPMYANSASYNFRPFGGPPAYDPEGTGRGTRTPNFGSATPGVDMGISVFANVTPAAGTYNLRAVVPTTGSSTTYNATTTFAGGAALPAMPTPTLAVPGDGTATVTYTLPAGVTGAYVQVVDVPGSGGGCNGVTAYYTKWVTVSGTFQITNANAPYNSNPGGPGHAFCTAADNGGPGDTVRANVVGFDYNHYGLTFNGPLNSTYPPAPALPASADISISSRATLVSP